MRTGNLFDLTLASAEALFHSFASLLDICTPISVIPCVTFEIVGKSGEIKLHAKLDQPRALSNSKLTNDFTNSNFSASLGRPKVDISRYCFEHNIRTKTPKYPFALPLHRLQVHF